MFFLRTYVVFVTEVTNYVFFVAEVTNDVTISMKDSQSQEK